MQNYTEQIPSLPIVYMRRTGPYGVENYQLMNRMKEWAMSQGRLRPDDVIYGIAHDNQQTTAPEECRYDVCLVVEAGYTGDEQVQNGTIPGGKNLVFRITHTAEAVGSFWSNIFSVLDKEGHQADMTRPIMERYQNQSVMDGFCEFCVPIL